MPYGGVEAMHIMDDLKSAFPSGMHEPFTYIDVANAILGMSRPAPISKSPYIVCWENENTADAIECDSRDQAISVAEDTLVEWVAQEMASWKSDIPTPEEIERYNYMIGNCSVEAKSYNPKTDEYELAWSPSHEDEKQLGWFEIEESGTPDFSL